MSLPSNFIGYVRENAILELTMLSAQCRGAMGQAEIGILGTVQQQLLSIFSVAVVKISGQPANRVGLPGMWHRPFRPCGKIEGKRGI